MSKSNFWLFILVAIIIFGISNDSIQSKVIVVPDDFISIQIAINSARGHDTVLVKPGSYHEFLVLKDSVVLMSDGEDDGNWNRASVTIIHSEGLRDSLGGVPPVVNCADGAVLDGFEITGMDTVNHHLPGHSHAVQNRGTSSTIKNCIVHNNGSTGIGSHEKDGRPAVPTIIHNKVYRNFGIGIGFNHFAKGEAKRNVVYENREVGIGIQNGAAPLVDNNFVYSNGWNGISAREGSKPIIRNNIVYSNGIELTGDEMPEGAGAGIGADSTGWMVKPGDTPGPAIIDNNYVYDNPSGGIMTRNNAITLITENRVFNNSNFQVSVNDSSQSSVHSNVIYLEDTSKYNGGGVVVIRGSSANVWENNISNVDLAGIMIGVDSHSEVHDNEIFSCKQSGIRADSTASTINIFNNSLKDNAALGILIKSTTSNVHHNLLVNNASGGISSDSSSISHIYNNTVVNKIDPPSGRGIFASGSESKIMNNIVWGYTLGIFKDNNSVIDYNCTFNNTGYNGPSGTGGQNAVNENPEFIDFDNDDYHLKANSPCINTGNPDPFYNDTNGSRADIGCYPYGIIGGTKDYTDKLNSFQVYPTIANDILTIKFLGENNASEKTIINVYNVLGNKVDEINFSGNPFNYFTFDLCAGLYFLRMQNANFSQSIPFIKE
ncbi:MAG: T9SS type A sorting domain-containing protein [Bacteroidetes bacterium]|nr:MAG: T9SS type A sorting domain-containing protein [Bacteroidota bacterium]